MRLERGGPSEHLLRAANQARLAGDWTTALEQIDKALEVEETPQAISRLQWLRLRCLYFGGRRSLAMRTLQSVLSAGPPQTVEEWRLAIRLFPRHANPQFVLNTAVEAIRRYPADLDLLLQLERLCSRTGRWEVSRPVFETLASMPVGDDSYCQAARLLCLAGMAMRDRELALAGAQRIVARPELFAGRNEFLRAYAAAVLGLDADAKGDFSDALLRGARQRETNARIGVAAGCAALRRRDNEGLLKAVSRMDEFAAEASFGPAWRLAAGALYSLTEDWVACARQGLMQLACNVLRDRLRAGPARVHEIHAFALANLALSRGYREQPERSGAIFRDALGGWAALLGEEQWLGGFVEARLQVYGIASPGNLVREIRERVSEMLLRSGEQLPDGERVKVLWRLECSAVERIREAGGLRLDNGGRINAGPLLANALGLHRSIHLIDSPELRLLYSPLGEAVALLNARDFDVMTRELEALRDSQDTTNWRLEDLQALLIQCRLDESKEAIVRSPVDGSILERAWQAATELAAAIGTEQKTKASIAEIAIGRAEVLFERRGAEQGVGNGDKRALMERRREAIEIERLTLKFAPLPPLKVSLARHLNRYALGLWNEQEPDSAVQMLYEAIDLQPAFQNACENLAGILRQGRRMKLTQGLIDEAGVFLMEGVDRLRRADPSGGIAEVQAALGQLRTYGPVPFCEQAEKAREEDDWPRAVKLFCWAAAIAPGDAHIAFLGADMLRELTLCVEHGRNELEAELEKLRQSLPQATAEA